MRCGSKPALAFARSGGRPALGMWASTWNGGAVRVRCREGKFAPAQNALLSTKSLLYPRPVEPERLERARNRRQEFKIDFEALAAIKKRLVILLTL